MDKLLEENRNRRILLAEQDRLRLGYASFTPHVVDIDPLNRRISDLETEVADLKKRVKALETVCPECGK